MSGSGVEGRHNGIGLLSCQEAEIEVGHFLHEGSGCLQGNVPDVFVLHGGLGCMLPMPCTLALGLWAPGKRSCLWVNVRVLFELSGRCRSYLAHAW